MASGWSRKPAMEVCICVLWEVLCCSLRAQCHGSLETSRCRLHSWRHSYRITWRPSAIDPRPQLRLVSPNSTEQHHAETAQTWTNLRPLRSCPYIVEADCRDWIEI
jgi:hypothetical protein